MNEGWVKLYRKSKDNLIMRDANSWMIFSWIMLTVDRDTGTMTLGRFWASEYFGLKPSTFYAALQRLAKKYKVITLTSNNKFTTVRLLNWSKYQQKEETVTQDDNTKVTPKQQQSNTLTRSKELRIKKGESNAPPKNSIRYLENLPLEDRGYILDKYVISSDQLDKKIQKLINYCKKHGRTYADHQIFLYEAIEEDYKEKMKEKVGLSDLVPDEYI